MAAKVRYSPVSSTDRRNSDRRPVDRPSTLRQDGASPLDVVVNDLSCHGFNVTLSNPPAIGSTISIGLPGIGRRLGTVARVTGDQVGCQFSVPLDDASVTAAFAVDPVVTGLFTALPVLDLDHEPHVEKWHPAMRATLIVASASAAWTMLFHLL